MSPWLFALTTRRRELVTETFTSSRTWVAPWGTTRIESMTGEGSDGTPETFTGEHYYFRQKSYYADGVLVKRDEKVFVGTFSGSAPGNYCDAFVNETAIGETYNQTQICHEFVNIVNPATNGTATTGFGQTFAGGTGAPATPATVSNVAVDRGASYSLAIPSGGSLSITYYR